jgi:hypothetical protein
MEATEGFEELKLGEQVIGAVQHAGERKLNPGLPWQKQLSERRSSFHQQIGLQFKEETSTVLQVEHSFIWC